MLRAAFAALGLLACACGGGQALATVESEMGFDTRGLPVLGMGRVAASFTAADPRLETGRFVHRYAIDLDPSMRVRLRLRGGGVDPHLEVLGPDGFHLANDDAVPGTLDALLDFVPPAAARYEVRASSVTPGEVGPYWIEVSARDPSIGLGEALPIGGRAQSVLVADPRADLPGAWLHFPLPAGAILKLRVQSGAFDTVATVTGPGGQVWMNDDSNTAGPDGTGRALDSALVVAAPSTGVYQLVVTSYSASQGGPFEILTALKPPVVGVPGSRVERHAGPDGDGRVHGLFVGITDYADHGDLYGCADDARLLAQAFQMSGLQTPTDQRVLVDAHATRQAFFDGVAALAAQMRHEDVAVVFFSGHGTRVPAAGPGVELDGLDETIVLTDGALRDDEVVGALDAVAGTVILAIDACHSGGFADDFVTRPNRIGLFSSDPDVLSSTAEPRRAGGYLSYHLRHGVLGYADARPRDGVLSVGELADYLHSGFVHDDAAINPASDHEPMQRLVIDRGSVSHPTMLWIYPRGPDLALPPLSDIPLLSASP